MPRSNGNNGLRRLKNFQPDRYLVWLRQADYDLSAAKASREKGFNEWACFQSSQALEKGLKAVLVSAGYRAPRIHKLGILMSMSNRAWEGFNQIKLDYRVLDSYTFVARYPFLLPGKDTSPHEIITPEDADECIASAENGLEAIQTFLNDEAQVVAVKPIVGNKFTGEEVDSRLKGIIDKLHESEFSLHKVILFGSFARRKERSRSRTMDILIVADTELSFFERIRRVKELVHGDEPIIEPLVYTPAEFNELLMDRGEGFLETALDEGVEVYSLQSTVGS